MLDPRNISVVAWDLDNTLYDRDDALRCFFRWYLVRLGYASSAAKEERGQVMLDAIMALDKGGHGDRLAFCREVRLLLGQNPDRAERLWSILRAKLPEFVTQDLHTAACLYRLRDHYRYALITNGGGTLQRAKLHRIGVAHYFPPESIFISGEVGYDKPDPRIFETALRALGQRPEQVLYVGDHTINDMAGAAAVGMRTCWVSRGHPRPPDLRCDVMVKDPWELESLLLPPGAGGASKKS